MINGLMWRRIIMTAEKKWGVVILAIGLILFLGVRIWFVESIYQGRQIPIEPDDSYGYILKAAEFDTCFLQKCPALNDLRKQTTAPPPVPEVADYRYREYHRTLFQYHLLHSAILYGLHKTGMSWERAYRATQQIGVVFLGLAVAYFLSVIWTPGAAGIALSIFSLTFFIGHGLHTPVPSNLTLAIALVLWGALIQGKRNAVFIISGIAALLLMHTIGRIYAVATIIFYLLYAPRPWKRPEYSVLTIGGVIIGAWSLLGYVIDRPALSISPYPEWSSTQSLAVAVLGNLKVLYQMVQDWVNNLGGRLEGVLFPVLGFLSLPKEMRFKAVSLTVITIIMMMAGLLHNYPNYFGVVVERLWIAPALMLMGATGYLVWKILKLAACGIRCALKGNFPDFPEKDGTLSARGWINAAYATIGIVIIISFSGMAFNGINFIRNYTYIVNTAHTLNINTTQPAQLIKLSKENESILYTGETPLYYFLINGALARGAVYYPAVKGTKDERPWIFENKRLRFAVIKSPVAEGIIKIKNGTLVQLGAETPGADSILMALVENPGVAPAGMAVKAMDGNGAISAEYTFSIPAGTKKWLDIRGDTQNRGRRFMLSMKNGNGFLKLWGIKRSPSQKTNWPWDSGLTVIGPKPGPKKGKATFLFTMDDLARRAARPVEIINDAGSFITGRYLKN